MKKLVRGPYAKTIKKAFAAAIEMRRGVLILALKEAHKFHRAEARKYENEILFRVPSQHNVIGKFIEELEELDDIIRNLSKFI